MLALALALRLQALALALKLQALALALALCLQALLTSLLFTRAYVIKQYNLVPVSLAAGKVTVGLASHWPCVRDISGSPPTGSRPRRGR